MDRDAKKKQEKNATTTIRRLTLAMVGLLIIAVAGAALLRYYRDGNSCASVPGRRTSRNAGCNPSARA